MADFIKVEIDASKFPREPFAGEFTMDDGSIATYREYPEHGPNSVMIEANGMPMIFNLDTLPDIAALMRDRLREES